MIGYKVNKKDLNGLNSRLSRLKVTSKKDVIDTLKDFGIRSQFDIKSDAPVDTGNLKQQVNWQMLNPNTVQVESIAIAENKTDYAPIQEFGSIYRTGKPYFYPNIKRNAKRALAMLRMRIKKNVK